MNLLIVVAHLRRGGLVEVVYNLCRRLIENKDIRLMVLSLRKEPVNSRVNDFTNLGIKVIGLVKSYLECEVGTGLVTRCVQQIVDKYAIDVVHCHGYHPALVCADLHKVKKMTTLHDRATEDFLNAFGPVMGRYMLVRYFHALKKFDMNVAVSQSGAELYRQYLPHVAFVNNGIDTNRFCVASALTRKAIRENLHLPDKSTIFVTSGRAEREKRCEELVLFFAKQGADKKTCLLVLGGGSRLNSCKALAKGHSNIFFTGQIANVKDYLQCADFYISYSKSEGMSMAVCEAVACGLFPVLSDIPAHEDVGKPVGAVLFNDIEKLDMPYVLSQKYDRCQLHEHIEAGFSVESMTDGYVKLYKKLCAE